MAVTLVAAAAGGAYAMSTLVEPPVVEAAGASESLVSTSPSPSPSPTPSPDPAPLSGTAVTRRLDGGITRATLDRPDPTHAAALAFFAYAPTVVISDGSSASLDVAATLALRHRAPLLLDAPGLTDVLDQLDATVAIAVGDVQPPPLEDVRTVGVTERVRSASAPHVDSRFEAVGRPESWGLTRLRKLAETGRSVYAADLSELPADAGRPLGPWRPAADAATVLLPRGAPELLGAGVTAMAAGHRTIAARAGDPRADPDIGPDLADADLSRVVLLGVGHWDEVDEAALGWQLEVARAGHELPGDGQLLFPGRRLVALYGTPGSASLGVLGEQPVEAAIERAREQAAAYQPHSDVPVVPAFEMIATVASGAAGADGDYSAERTVAELEPWVEAAAEAGLYVVLDLQPGRQDFLSQAQQYEPLLARPHVGLALDPEWRLGPTQRHLVQVGGVDAAEVNAVSSWLADLVRAHALPQKLFIVHQFKLSMIRERSALVARPELATVIQMDGQGGQGVKLATWEAILRDPPRGIWWGWKNFHDEDEPTRTPEATMALEPEPVFVSYQ